jgi:VWFA-related protein
MGRTAWATCAVFAAFVAASPFSATIVAGQQNPQPTFRGAVTVVPVDVRVIDNKSRTPVTDLRQEDFTVFDDGVRQDIRHFLVQNFTLESGPTEAAPATAAPGAKPAVRQSPLSLTPQTNRIFLIVLGRGRLQDPSRGLDAVLHFVRDRLLPRDQVAVFAYNRASDFTTDHELTAQVLERFRQENNTIAAEIDHAMSGLAAVYGSQELPDAVQARLDRIFAGTGALPFQNVGRAENGRTGTRTHRDAQKGVDDAIEGVIAANRATPENAAAMAPPAVTDWSTFDSFVAEIAQTLQDAGNLYAAIAYMRRLEGEKHLVFVTEAGMQLPRVEDDTDLARVAADGRVVIDIVQTGGVMDVLAARALRNISEPTGGLASISEYSQPALDRLDTATRAGYLLGYYPSNTKWDGTYRNITIKVNRPDVTVLFRHGYHGHTVIPEFDRREYITRYRVEAAASYRKDVKDIGVKLSASLGTVNGQTVVNVDARVDPAHLYFNIRNGVRFGRVDIAVVAMDEKRAILGGTYKKMAAHLEYDKATFEIVRKQGIPCQVQVRVPSGSRYVRVVIYDYMADLVGTASTWLF